MADPAPPPPPASASSCDAAITRDEVLHVAKLARLRITDEQATHFAGQLAAVLAHVNRLQEVDTDGVLPMTRPLEATNVLRDDEAEPGWPREAMLANAPVAAGPFFGVPPVMGSGA